MTRYAPLLVVTALSIATAGVVAGCASSRSVLYSGVSAGASGTRHVVSDTAASDDVQAQLASWVADIARRGREDPSERFANLSAQQFRRRLAAAAARYHFTVKKAQFLHPAHAAPLVIVQTRDYLALARAVPAIDSSLDPHTGHNDRTGWAYEAFFLEAQDERGIPFIAVSNFMRGAEPGGGQWARSNQLYPFAHG